jgi:hypothetical protein
VRKRIITSELINFASPLKHPDPISQMPLPFTNKLLTMTSILRSAGVVLALFLFTTTTSCYQYRVLNTESDPSTEYQDTILHSYAWGLIQKPKVFNVPNCDNTNAIDEVTLSKNVGQSLLTWITFGYVSKVKVQWRCSKPCPRVED